jgi:hypothetical protein
MCRDSKAEKAFTSVGKVIEGEISKLMCDYILPEKRTLYAHQIRPKTSPLLACHHRMEST